MCFAALHVDIMEENVLRDLAGSVFGLHANPRMHACVGTHALYFGNKLSNLASIYTYMIAANSVQLP